MIGILFFELFIIVFTIGLFFYLKRVSYKNTLRKFVIMFFGVLLFEVMSEPMWKNYLLDSWAYLYRDVSWLITIGWVDIFLVSMMLVDNYYQKLNEKKKFWIYLLFVTVITSVIEVMLLKVGIRGYAPILKSKMSGLAIPFTKAPIEIIPTVPIIAALVISFYNYINHLFE